MVRLEPERTAHDRSFTIRLDDEMLAKLDALAADTDRSRSWIAAKAIEAYVELNAWQIEQDQGGHSPRPIAGEFATEEEVTRPCLRQVSDQGVKTASGRREALAELDAIFALCRRRSIPSWRERLTFEIDAPCREARAHSSARYGRHRPWSTVPASSW